MNFETRDQEQATIGKQQLLIKMQLAGRENAPVAKQQLLVKAGLAKAASERALWGRQ